MFSSEGQPVRANCTVKLIGTGAVSWGQNPTSGGDYPARAAVIGDHQTLPVLVHEYYGRASRWKEVAAYNDIDNPFAIGRDRTLVLPDLETRRRYA
jgi:hypothetical protein